MTDCRATAAAPFVLEVLARWMHQSSTRELSKLGNIQVKIWVLPFTEGEMDALIGEFEKLLRAALRRDGEEIPGGGATKALKAVITFLYHNVDLIHGGARHRLVKMVLKVGFLRLFLNPSDEVGKWVGR